MNITKDPQSPATGGAALAGRTLIAALFLVSAIAKLAAPAGTQGYIAAFGLPFPKVVYAATIALELGAGALLAVGWHTRLAAGILLAFTLLAAFVFHTQFGNQNELVHFLKNAAIAGGLLHVLLLGGGTWSIDARANGLRGWVPAQEGSRT